MYFYDSIAVIGPTASGKTKFAVNLALALPDLLEGLGKKICGAEIISADSRQVYRGMDIGTGKDLSDYSVERNGVSLSVPYHLMNIADAGSKYNIFQYQRDFSKAYSSILERGAYPIICGGSGLYVQAVTCGYDLKDVSPDNELRAKLETKSMTELVEMLAELKAGRGEKLHNSTDYDTKKRVIRAIEIERAYVSGSSETTSVLKTAAIKCEEQNISGRRDEREGKVSGYLLPKKVLYIGVEVDRDERNRRIDRRLSARLQEGMIDEVQKLLDSGIKPEDLIYYGLEYKFVTLYLIGELSYDEMVEKLSIAIHQFAKRQMTWFRGMERKGICIWWTSDGVTFFNNLDNKRCALSELLNNYCYDY